MMNIRSATGFGSARARNIFALCAAMLGAALGAAAAAHADGDWVTTEQTQVRLFSAVTSTGDLKSIPLGLGIRLKPGWKTYWRSPGDAGFPVELTFDGSENLRDAKMAYPAPHRFELFGLQTFGYGEQVVFPVDAAPVEVGKALAVKAHLRYLVCEQVCIPYDADLTLIVPQGPAQPGVDAALLNKFRSMVPGDGRAVGLDLVAL